MSLNYKNNELGGVLNQYSFIDGLKNEILLRNRNLYSIFFIKQGEISLEVDFEELKLASGNIIFLSPGQNIKILKEELKQGRLINFNREFYCIEKHDDEVSCNGLLFKGVMKIPLLNLKKNDISKVEVIFSSFESEADEMDRIHEEMLRILLKQLIIFCTRLARTQLNVSFNFEDEEADTIRHFSALVDKHFRNLHKVSDYASILNKSPKTLSNLFNKYNSVSPSEMIKERIILEAKRALIYTDMSNKEIAYEIGFEDPAHFSKYFSKATTMSPSKFKEVYFKLR